MKKQLRLKKEVKEFMGLVLVILVGCALLSSALLIGANRIEKIENGGMVLVNQNQMDR